MADESSRNKGKHGELNRRRRTADGFFGLHPGADVNRTHCWKSWAGRKDFNAREGAKCLGRIAPAPHGHDPRNKEFPSRPLRLCAFALKNTPTESQLTTT